MLTRLFFCVSVLFTFSLIAAAQDGGEWSSQGEVKFEMRQFKQDDETQTKDSAVSMFSRAETRYETDSFKFVLRGFGRGGQQDQNRSLVILEDGYASYTFGVDNGWKVLAGFKVFNWTATEAFHPVDIINSRNFDSDFENFEKRGELTVELEKDFWNGTINLYYWPKYEKPIFPGPRSRLGFGPETLYQAIQDPVFVNGKGSNESGTQYGARIAQTFGDADVSLHYLNHMDRFMPIIGNQNYMTVSSIVHPSQLAPTDLVTLTIPYYFEVKQIGGTLQWVLGPFIVKAEGASRKFEKPFDVLVQAGNARFLSKPVDHEEVALGVEFGTTHPGGSESFFFLETNSIMGTTRLERERLSMFQQDAFIGYRLAFNDVNSTELFASIIYDLERDSEMFYSLSYSQRVGNNWKISTGVRIYEAPQKLATPVGLEIFDGDSFAFFNLSRFF